MCGTQFNRKKGTPLEGLRTPLSIIITAIMMYMCRMSVSAIALVLGKQEKTIERWIKKISPHCEDIIKHKLNRKNHNFISRFLQMDELWSYAWKKNAKLWIWTGIDVTTRLFIAFHIGDRTICSAEKLIKTIKARTNDIPTLITTDGFSAYIEPINKFFKKSMYAQVVKVLKGWHIVKVTKTVISDHLIEQIEKFIKKLGNVGRTINTSYVERFNLTLRQSLCSLVRKTLSAVKIKDELRGQTYIFQTYYNFIRPHMSLTIGKGKGKLKGTPAMAAGLTDCMWNWEEMLTYHPNYHY